MKRTITLILVIVSLLALVSCATANTAETVSEQNVYDAQYPGKVLNQTTGATYSTLRSALEAAGSGDTIIMCKNETTDETIRISKSVVLDLNGHTITGTNNGATIFVRDLDSKATLDGVEIKNGKVTGNPKGAGTSSLFGFVMVTNVKLSDLTLVSDVEPGTTDASAFYVNGSQVVADNLTVIGKTVCYNKSNGVIDLVINGGTFKTDPNASTDYVIKFVGDAVENPGSIVLNDVTMTGSIEVGNNPPKATFVGGTFSEKISSFYIADGYKCVQNGNVYNIVAK